MQRETVEAPVTTEQMEVAFSEGLENLEDIATQLVPFGPNSGGPQYSGPSIRIRPYAVSWAFEQLDERGQWRAKAWGKTGPRPKAASRIMSLMAPGAPCKRTAEMYEGKPNVIYPRRKVDNQPQTDGDTM